MNRRTLTLSIAGAVALAGGGTAWWLAGGRSAPARADPAAAQSGATADAEAFARVPDMVRGAADAPVTVIEYASLTCPHCATFHRTVLPRIVADYVDTGRVRWIMREVYFDRPGLWAAMLARCGGEARYFAMIDMLFETQREWASSNDPAAIAQNLVRLGRRTGLSEDEINTCLQDAEQAQAMVAVYQHHAVEHEVQATPSFVINGQKHSNMGFDDFSAVIDALIQG
jgi:protein-disulfide isomerase